MTCGMSFGYADDASGSQRSEYTARAAGRIHALAGFRRVGNIAAITAYYLGSGTPRLRIAPITPAAAINIKTAANPPMRERGSAAGDAGASAHEGASVDDTRALTGLLRRKGR